MLPKEKKYSTIDTVEKSKLLANWLEEKQGGEILGLDVRGLSEASEVMIITTGQGARHTQALADFLLEKAKDENLEYLGMEGYKGAEWILMDFNDVLIHVFQGDVREYFNLEGLWAEAEVLFELHDEDTGAE